MKKTILRRLIYAGSIVALSVIALVVRRANGQTPNFFNTYFPDTAWTMAGYCLLGLLFDRSPLCNLVGALAISYLVELSQLWHPAFLEALRATRLGGLILGYGFLWSDLICYTVGALLCFGVQLLVRKHFLKSE